MTLVRSKRELVDEAGLEVLAQDVGAPHDIRPTKLIALARRPWQHGG